MNNNIKALVTNSVNLTEEEWLVFSQFLVIKKYKKGDYFLKENDYCNYVGFVDKGFFNFYYLIDGVQHIRGFFFQMNLFLTTHVFFQRISLNFIFKLWKTAQLHLYTEMIF